MNMDMEIKSFYYRDARYVKRRRRLGWLRINRPCRLVWRFRNAMNPFPPTVRVSTPTPNPTTGSDRCSHSERLWFKLISTFALPSSLVFSLQWSFGKNGNWSLPGKSVPGLAERAIANYCPLTRSQRWFVRRKKSLQKN